MLIIGLVLAFALYVVLYLMWESAQSQLHRATPLLDTANRMLFRPEHALFEIMRNLMLVVLLYLIVDFLFSSARGVFRRKRPESQPYQAPKKPKDQSHRGESPDDIF